MVCSVGKDLDLSRGMSSKSIFKYAAEDKDAFVRKIKSMYPDGVVQGKLVVIDCSKTKIPYKKLYMVSLPVWNKDIGKVCNLYYID